MNGIQESQTLEFAQNVTARTGTRKKWQNECPSCNGWKEEKSVQCRACRKRKFEEKRICPRCGGKKEIRGDICDKCHRADFVSKYTSRGWYEIRGCCRTPESYRKMGEARRGEKNPFWKGDDVCPNRGRDRARKAYSSEPCEICGRVMRGINRHHIDGNTKNNVRSNIQFLCGRCHMTVDGRMDKLLKLNESRRVTPMSRYMRKKLGLPANDFQPVNIEQCTVCGLRRKI